MCLRRDQFYNEVRKDERAFLDEIGMREVDAVATAALGVEQGVVGGFGQRDGGIEIGIEASSRTERREDRSIWVGVR